MSQYHTLLHIQGEPDFYTTMRLYLHLLSNLNQSLTRSYAWKATLALERQLERMYPTLLKHDFHTWIVE